MATAKAFAADGVRPVFSKYPASLGAPFTASWNDHILVEEPLCFGHALLVRLFGLGLGSNIVLLAAHLLAATAFYPAARALGSNRLFASVCASLFALSTFSFTRSLQHLILTYYWHVPLGLLVIWWCFDKGRWTPRRVLAALAIGILHGIQNPYYTNIFGQLLVLAGIVAWVRRRPAKEIVFPLLILLVTIGAFGIMNLDTLFFRITHGTNDLVTIRRYEGLEQYALKPIELFLPGIHRLAWLQQWASDRYFTRSMFLGERGSAYLGIIAIAGLVWLSWHAVKGIARDGLGKVPRHFWVILWILLYGVVGGINGLLGTFGMALFRATNRLSIVIMATALLFLAGILTQRSNGWRRLTTASIAFFVLITGLWDQAYVVPANRMISQAQGLIAADRKLVGELESRLPPQAMIFQMPIMDYPEADPIEKMSDYEHFRPYLHSETLRFSYGSDKGRARERWQRETSQLGSEAMLPILERYGFAALLINKKGYADRGAALVAATKRAGRNRVIGESPDFICLALLPATEPSLPPEFDWHWHALETGPDSTWRWSEGNASIVLHNEKGRPRTVHLTCELRTNGPRRIVIRTGSQQLYERNFNAIDPGTSVDLPLPLPSGSMEIQFETDRAGELPGNGDPRKLAFNVRNFRVTE